MSSHRRLWAVVAATVTVVLVTSPVWAAKWDFVASSSGISASAQTEFVCSDNGDGTATCSSANVFVFSGRSKEIGSSTVHHEQVCYNESTDTFVADTGEPISFVGLFGCELDTSALTIDDLASITLEPTEISLVQFTCDADDCTEAPDGTVVVSGEWTAVGPASSQVSKNRYMDEACVQMDSMKGTFRQADFSGTVDSDPLVSEFADMSDGTFSFRSRCAAE